MPSSFVSQIDLIGAICKFLDKKHGVKTLLHREFNTVIRCATEIVNELAKPELPVIPGMGLDAWLACDHTGVSSEFMAGVLSGRFMRQPGYPHDPGDLCRCVGLLDACPELRANMSLMSEHGPEWRSLVECWDELESLFREERPSGSAPRLMARMSDLLKA
jgi:hypothetical protein